MKDFFKKILKYIKSWFDLYRQPGENLLSAWFESLYTWMQNEEKKGNIIEKIWYQKPQEMEITDIPNNSPLYKIKTLMLPETIRDGKKYYPQISEVSLVAEIPARGQPEIQTWKLNLSLFDENGKNIWPDVVFSRLQSVEDQECRHEIQYLPGRQAGSDSRDLTLYEVKFIKAVFDKVTA